MGLSIRAYARHRGVSHTAVKKAIDSGRITLEPDGTIDPARADIEWAQNTAPRRSSARKTAAAPSPQESGEPVALPLSPGGTTLVQARTFNEMVKAQINKVRLANLKGELVDRNQAIAHVFKLARAERDAWLNWPARISAQLASRLGVDAHALHVALEEAVREHLAELGEFKVRID
jgi:hypothetical protein